MEALLTELSPQLPQRVYAHLSPGLDPLFTPEYMLEHHGEHNKMVLTDPARLDEFDTGQVVPLGIDRLPELESLYQAAYPGNWFDARMLKTGQYVGIRSLQGALICVAGVHVFSERYRVAALGNITTHPDFRGQGLATTATAGLCKRMVEKVDVIGLNVLTSNQSAIHAYKKVGFEIITTYHEWMMARVN
jgi:ribosomal protein S18 acetylase RimI-like enzyme